MVSAVQISMRRTKVDYVNGTPLQLALREMRRNISSPRVLTGMVGAVAVLTISGPFNTLDQFDTPHRVIYWMVIVVLSFILARGVAAFVLGLVSERLDAAPARIVIATLASSVPSWLVVWFTTLVATGGHPDIDPLRLWLYCVAIGLALVVMLVVMARTEPTASPAIAEQAPAILERLPHPRRGHLSYLSVKDHYVDVVTEKGTTLVLMRLSDAIRETSPVRGVQIHRSHWIALDAVTNVIRVEGKPMVEMRDGARLPISRGFMAAAKEAGLRT